MPRHPYDEDRYFFDDRYDMDRFGNHDWNSSAYDEQWVDPNRRLEKSDHPYSYSEFFHFGNRRIIAEQGIHGQYSDRLWEWDPAKFDRLWKEHMNVRWADANRHQLNAFMSAYEGKKVEVVALAEGCNVGNGYPYFIVWHKEVA